MDGDVRVVLLITFELFVLLLLLEALEMGCSSILDGRLSVSFISHPLVFADGLTVIVTEDPKTSV